MTTTIEASLVVAARDGDRAALDELVAAHLPLVYAIVGRALQQEFDIDDTVQETMLNVVRGLSELRDPAAFRSWLVAITMNQIRKHRRRRHQPELRPPEAFDGLTDPASDFAEATLWQLGLVRQRREAAEAAVWLGEDDRELLSLWWLQQAGRLSRAEVVTALGQDRQSVAMRIARMKKQLDTVRGAVRALAAKPVCPRLEAATAHWAGAPSPLWRKRIARHVRDCAYCLSAGDDLIPAEYLLSDLSPGSTPNGVADLVDSQLSNSAAESEASYQRVPPSVSVHGSGRDGARSKLSSALNCRLTLLARAPTLKA